MNEEENGFERTENAGQDASELHSFGGMKEDAPEETAKTENEELADAIEELESDEVENSIPSEKDETITEEVVEEKAEESKPVMTIDAVEEPKAKKGGTGWKIATFLFAVIAVLGCGAACYLFFVNGTTKFLGREVSSKVAGTASPTAPVTPSTPAETPTAGRYIYLDGYDYAIKIPDGFYGFSYIYQQSRTNSGWIGDFSSLAINTATKKSGASSTPSFLGESADGNFQSMGYIEITQSEPQFQQSAPDLAFKLDSKHYVYYYHWQSLITNEGGSEEEQQWELETREAVMKWLTNKDNYIKLK